MSQTRGERNNNPGNIKELKNDTTHWQGERTTDDDPEMEEFINPEGGIRALAKILLTYFRRYKLMTVYQIIKRWAPPVENDTMAYVRSVANYMAVHQDEVLDLLDQKVMNLLVRAIIRQENGRMSYTSEQVAEGVRQAYV